MLAIVRLLDKQRKLSCMTLVWLLDKWKHHGCWCLGGGTMYGKRDSGLLCWLYCETTLVPLHFSLVSYKVRPKRCAISLSRSIVTVGKRVITFEFVISPTLWAQPTNFAWFDRRPPMKTWLRLRNSLESEVWSRIPETSWGGRGQTSLEDGRGVNGCAHTHTH